MHSPPLHSDSMKNICSSGEGQDKKNTNKRVTHQFSAGQRNLLSQVKNNYLVCEMRKGNKTELYDSFVVVSKEPPSQQERTINC